MDASHMAVVHNVILRGYNSIYKQAQHIRPHDVCDFLGYSKAWIDMVLGHHHSEEAVLFPMLADAAGIPGLMDTDKDEHGINSIRIRVCVPF
jgi:hemerythrin-like domain-containing protein